MEAMTGSFNYRLLNESTMLGTDSILERLPTEHSPALEQAIRLGVRQAVLHYAEGLDTQSRQLQPLAYRRSNCLDHRESQ